MCGRIPKFENIALLWLRILMGCGIAYHGYTKIFEGGMTGFTQMVGGLGFPIPSVFAWLAALAEFAGGILVVIGLGTRFAALSIFITMLVAAFIALGSNPYTQKELALAFLVMSGVLVLAGPGKISLDNKICGEGK